MGGEHFSAPLLCSSLSQVPSSTERWESFVGGHWDPREGSGGTSPVQLCSLLGETRRALSLEELIECQRVMWRGREGPWTSSCLALWVSSFPRARLANQLTKPSECRWRFHWDVRVHTFSFFYSVILCTRSWFEASCVMNVSSTSLNVIPDFNKKAARSSRKCCRFIGSVKVCVLGQGFWFLMGWELLTSEQLLFS